MQSFAFKSIVSEESRWKAKPYGKNMENYKTISSMGSRFSKDP